MKHKLFLLYLSGLVSVAVSLLQTVPYKYSLVMKSMTWSDAQSYCRVMYTDLATVVNYTDWLKLEREAASKYFTGPAWVGLYNAINSWRWSLNDVPLTTYANWYPGEPSTYAGIAICAALGEWNYWWDSLCTIQRPFICSNAKVSDVGSLVGISSVYLTWSEARAYCRTYYTDLASSLSSTDNSLLGQIHDIQGDSWFGLYRDTWTWSDGTVSDFPWAPGQITNYWSDENCALANNGQFSQEICTNLHYFFCYTFRPEREQQIVRLQVESNGNVFDSAVQSSILVQITQKLKENSMLENTTVTWRVQPDGNIFYKKKKN